MVEESYVTNERIFSSESEEISIYLITKGESINNINNNLKIIYILGLL